MENLDDQNMTWTVNDVYNILITDDRPIEFLRFNWVSENGSGAEIELLYAARY